MAWPRSPQYPFAREYLAEVAGRRASGAEDPSTVCRAGRNWGGLTGGAGIFLVRLDSATNWLRGIILPIYNRRLVTALKEAVFWDDGSDWGAVMVFGTAMGQGLERKCIG